MADQGFMARARRSGYLGEDVKTYQEQEDAKENREIFMYHKASEDKLNQIADASHQDHKNSTGQVPDTE